MVSPNRAVSPALFRCRSFANALFLFALWTRTRSKTRDFFSCVCGVDFLFVFGFSFFDSPFESAVAVTLVFVALQI
jgi:hypothetical protein